MIVGGRGVGVVLEVETMALFHLKKSVPTTTGRGANRRPKYETQIGALLGLDFVLHMSELA